MAKPKVHKAQRAVHIARERGYRLDLQDSLYIQKVAKRRGLKPSYLYALYEGENGFKNIFGGDYGDVGDQPPYYHHEVTPKRYAKFYSFVARTKRSNGVGWGQVTYYTYILKHPGLFRKRAQIKLSSGILADNIKRYGLHQGFRAYNGTGSAAEAYADQMLRRVQSYAKAD